MSKIRRRDFLLATSGSLGLQGVLDGLGPVAFADVTTDRGVAQFSGDIEPLVRIIEETPRDQLIQAIVSQIQGGLSYRRLLAATLLAGVRNVQPRPSVGFKFHAVLVVHSAHLASLNSRQEDRWLPLLWAVDNFKSSQARDVQEGDWTLGSVDEARVPKGEACVSDLQHALENWDEEAADAAITGCVRTLSAHDLFRILAGYSARDFRSIGHKVIYLSNAFRTLQTIGWEHAEPVLRSLVYAMLNHQGDPNPAKSDLAADRSGRANQERLSEIKGDWLSGKPDEGATKNLLASLHGDSEQDVSELVIEMLNRGVATQSIWNAFFCSAAELSMRQRGIVSLHAVTTTNAIHQAFKMVSDEETRKFLLLQNAAFLPLFREAARGRGKLTRDKISELSAGSIDSGPEGITRVFDDLTKNRKNASRSLLQYLNSGGEPRLIADHARRLVFLKGNDSHDYKFSSAALEDYRYLTGEWRNRYLAASCFQLRGGSEPTRSLVGRVEKAMRS